MPTAPQASKPSAEATPHAEVIPLTRTHPGQEVVLIRVDGGKAFQHRLAEMGLTPGTHLGVLVAGRPGPFIVSVKDMRLVLGRGLVEHVHVRPL